MSRQDKSTSERHTRTLRELVKKPENKVCADCKRNDPRWASWNLGVFLCIRCSGIHRGMGTHISKIKSVDLDIWTPEQMESIQKWGNARANLYWEAHLKSGHIPAEHKMESFIRSKYESKRWALEGPPPRDPSVLEAARGQHSESASPSPPLSQQSSRQPQTTVAPQRQSHTLLSSQTQQKIRAPAQAQSRPSEAAQIAVPAPTPTPQDDLFSLDFHAPASSSITPASPGGPKKDVKNDILSLFASTPSASTGVTGGFGVNQQHATAQPANMTGGTGAAMWRTPPAWNGLQAGQPPQGNVWVPQQQHFGSFQGSAQPHQTSGSILATQNVWEGSNATALSTGDPGSDLFGPSFTTTAPPQPAKKDDAFGDLWGGFK